MKIAVFVFCFLFLLAILFSQSQALAAGSATVSWVAPTTDEGGGALTGLAGYRVYHDTASHWTSSCPLGSGTYVDVPGGTTTSYFFNNNLTAETTHYFTVVAYDDQNPSNISGCATDGTDTEVSKVVSYSGDLVPNQAVDIFDYNLLHTHYSTSESSADINKDGAVNIFDYNILHGDYGSSF